MFGIQRTLVVLQQPDSMWVVSKIRSMKGPGVHGETLENHKTRHNFNFDHPRVALISYPHHIEVTHSWVYKSQCESHKTGHVTCKPFKCLQQSRINLLTCRERKVRVFSASERASETKGHSAKIRLAKTQVRRVRAVIAWKQLYWV